MVCVQGNGIGSNGVFGFFRAWCSVLRAWCESHVNGVEKEQDVMALKGVGLVLSLLVLQ